MKKTFIAALILATGLFACQVESDGSNQPSASGGGGDPAKLQQANSQTPAAKPDQTPAIPDGPGEDTKAPEPPANQKITSLYTDLDEKKCKTLDKNEDEGWIVQECPGIGGYKLEVLEGDIRQTINVISPANKKSELNLWRVVSPAFSYVGKKAEWRVKNVKGKPRPFALIVRYDASENPENPDRTTSYLTVSKIEGDLACVTDIVKPVKNANVIARKLADSSANKPCKAPK